MIHESDIQYMLGRRQILHRIRDIIGWIGVFSNTDYRRFVSVESHSGIKRIIRLYDVNVDSRS